MRRMICCLLWVVALFLLEMNPGPMCANPATPITAAVAGYGEVEGTWWVWVILRNTSATEASLKMSPVILDSAGKEYLMDSIDPRTLGMVFPGGSAISVTAVDGHQATEISLPPRDEKSAAAVFRFPFKLPAGKKPFQFQVSPGIPVMDLSKLPIFPLLPTPRMRVEIQQPDLLVTLGKVVRAKEEVGEAGKPGMPGLVKAYQTLDPAFSSQFTVNMVTDFSVTSSTQWLLVALTLNNKTTQPVEVSLERIVVRSKAPAAEKEGYKLAGTISDGGARLGSPFTEKITIQPKIPQKVNLVFTLGVREIKLQEFTLVWQ